jgi:hypothetical protein
MKLAIMQPYLFPYLGYYQLLAAVDRFVVYDDVQFMLQGWINRNNILVNGKPLLFTLPLEATSANKNIVDTQVNARLFPVWFTKFRRTLQQAYSKAPYLGAVLEIVDKTMADAVNKSIAEVATESLRQVHQYLELRSEVVPSSVIYQNSELKSQARVLDICRQEGATQYINPINGQSLYSAEAFQEVGIQLNFIKMHDTSYKQLKGEFVPNLSMLDVLMFNEPAAIQEMLANYSLI